MEDHIQLAWWGKKHKCWQDHEIQTNSRLKKYGQARDVLPMISLSNLRPNCEEAFFIIIITIIIVIDLRVIGIDKNEQKRISRHFPDNCVQRRVFFFCL